MTLSKSLKSGAIWGFIVLELIFFSVAGEYLSLSDKAFMDLDNMLLLLKQSAPIGIIALGMTVVMINGNIDLSVGAIFALCAVVMLDSQTWAIFEGLGDWVIPLCLGAGAADGYDPRPHQRADRVENRGRRLHRHLGVDARLSGSRVHVQRREPDLATELDPRRFRRSDISGSKRRRSFFSSAPCSCGC
jgi:hypothetical protein